jgi:hypothetical protein
LALLMQFKGKKKPSTRHVPCTVNATDKDLVKSAITLDNSEAWGSDEDL